MKKPPKNIKDEILAKRMFQRESLSDNIVHEIINLFRADNGNNYIYANLDGGFDIKHIGHIGMFFQVRNYAIRPFEVLAKTRDLESFFDKLERT